MTGKKQVEVRVYINCHTAGALLWPIASSSLSSRKSSSQPVWISGFHNMGR